MMRRQAIIRKAPPADPDRQDSPQSSTSRVFGSLSRAAALGLFALLGGCNGNMILMDPRGPIAAQEKHLILVALGLMLVVVIPVILLTLYFAWKYRASNTSATYAPNWSHSTVIEVICWGVPCVIIAILGVLIWNTTHTLDPYRPIATSEKPVRVEVVSMDWKWLFIYPDYGVASVNQLAIPVGKPIDFEITSQSVMNSFSIPQLGSQIYSMAGMQTQLHLIADTPGEYAGLSANFSGPGFSDMNFKALAMTSADFDAWVAKAHQSKQALDETTYQALTQPSENVPVALYSSVVPNLFEQVLAQHMNSNQQTGMQMQGMQMQSPAKLAAE
jgi:cytochrome o ubiquinol oxidase subunit 2